MNEQKNHETCGARHASGYTCELDKGHRSIIHAEGAFYWPEPGALSAEHPMRAQHATSHYAESLRDQERTANPLALLDMWLREPGKKRKTNRCEFSDGRFVIELQCGENYYSSVTQTSLEGAVRSVLGAAQFGE